MAEVRAKFPQYNDMSDGDLAQALHKRYYSDLPFDQFAGKIGLAAADADPLSARQKPATTDQKMLSSMPMKVARGMTTDAVDAGAQYLPWALGAVSGGFGMAPNKVSDFFFSESDRVSKGITEREDKYQAARKATGETGFDSARLLGNVLSPVNMALGAGVGTLPATIAAQFRVGAGMGVLGSLTAPVYGADSSTLGETKAGQAAAGAVAGAVLTPVAVKAAEVLGNGLDKIVTAARKWAGKGEVVNEQVVYNSIRTELAREKIDIGEVPEQILSQVKAQVQAAMKDGKTVSPAALLRKADFEAVGAQGTLGQITRDPVQYTREMNLRGVAGPGDPLMRRFSEQRQQFGNVLGGLGANKADDAYAASGRLGDALASFDAPQKARVDALYSAARDSGGRSAQMNTAQFSQTANDALDSQMLGGALPEQARTLLNKVSKGEIPLNVDTSVQLRRTLEGIARDATRQGNKQGALAVRQVTSALDTTGVESSAGVGAIKAFNEARSAAARRFSVIDKNPALKAFLDGDVDADKFVSKYVLNGATDDLKQLSGILNPDGKTVVRQQIAAHLESKAFGSNVTADAPFAVERFNESLKGMGREKLSAFFTKEEVDQLFTLGRAAAWAGKRPAGSAVNESNTAAAAMNLLSSLRGASIGLPFVKQVRDTMVVNRGLLAKPPTQPVPILAPALRELVSGVPVTAGMAAGGLLSYQ
jgi:hypothetical protein